MRWLPALALFLGLSGSAQAATLFEFESLCACDPAPGGTFETTLLSGVLSDYDEDYYQFDFAQDVAYFSIRPASPNIEGDLNYREFDLGLFAVVQTDDGPFEFPVDICYDCWFNAGVIEVYDLPAGTYIVGVADFGGTISNDEPPPPVLPQGLGAYTVAVNAVAVPEPASLALLALGVAGLAASRRRA